MKPRTSLCLLTLAATLQGLACAPSSPEATTADVAQTATAEAGEAATAEAAQTATAAADWSAQPVVAGTAPDHPYSAEQIERGRQLATYGGCTDCHTPMRFDPEVGAPVPDMTRFLAGHPSGAPDPVGKLEGDDAAVIGSTFTSFRVPFGVVYAMNLTPDIDTGTGSWTEEMFINIFRRGKHLGGEGRPVLPPMPWLAVASLPDEDLVAIFAYLRSLPPVRNLVPSPAVPDEALMAIDAGNQAMLESH